MKRLIIACLWGMVFIMLGFAQTQEGRGTWYETDSKGLSASHSNLPFGTRVRVTNLQNERQVIVTIDNRIPDTPNRIIDIAKAAADNLEMNPRGTTPVRVEVIARRQSDSPVEIAASPPPSTVPVEAVSPAIPETTPPIVRIQSDPPSQPNPGMVNQTIITFNGMPNYTQTPGSVSLAPTPSVIAPGGRQVTIQGEPMLVAQEVPVPAPGPVRPEPVLQTPEPIIASPAPIVASPQPMIMQPVVVPPVVVPPVIAAPILAEPVLAPPVLAEPVMTPPVVAEPVMTAPITTEPVMSSPITVPMVNSEPVITLPLTTEPAGVNPAYSEPTIPIIPTSPGIPTVTTPSSIPHQTFEPQKLVRVLPRMPDLRSGKLYRLQVGAFSNEVNAREAIFRLREVGFEPAYEFYGGYCRVVITGVRAPDIETVVGRIGAAGFGQVFIREEL